MLKSIFKRLFADCAGNFASMAAVLMLPILGAAGLAVDITQAMSLKTELLGAADAAVLGAVADGSPGMAAIAEMSGNGSVPTAEADAINLFNGYLIGRPSIDIAEIEATVEKTGTRLRSELTFTARMQTNFMRIVGIDTIDVSSGATAVVNLARYQDFFLLLDNSPSMGVAATLDDIDEMRRLTASYGSEACAFACHTTDDPSATDNFDIARAHGVTLRVDVVTQAAQRLMDTATNERKFLDQFQMAVYSFGESAEEERLTRVVDLTDDLDQAKSGIGEIGLMTIGNHGDPNNQSDFSGMMSALNAQIGTVGNGTNTDDREKIVFFVSDGVGNSIKPYGCLEPVMPGGRCQETINVETACQALKDRGIQVAVLYTTYLPLESNSFWRQWIRPFDHEIAPAMEACATPGFYFEVSPTEGIAEAMEALFLRIINKPRLTS